MTTWILILFVQAENKTAITSIEFSCSNKAEEAGEEAKKQFQTAMYDANIQYVVVEK